jgi:ABC-type glycerol-3-phosphate transport system permease component
MGRTVIGSRGSTFGRYGLIAVVSVLVLYPFLAMVSFSLRTNHDLLSDPSLLPTNLTFENYQNMWSVAPFADFFRNSLITSTATTLLVLLIGAPAAYVLQRHVFPGQGVVRSFLFYTQLLPVAGLLLPMFLLVRQLGLYNTSAGLAAVYIGLFLPVAAIMLQGFFAQVPRDFEEAAYVDGATPFQAFRWIALPLALPGLVAVASVIFIATWEEYILALTLTAGNAARTVPIGLTFFFQSHQTDYAGLMAASVVSTLPVVVALMLSGRFIIRGMAHGGLRG